MNQRQNLQGCSRCGRTSSNVSGYSDTLKPDTTTAKIFALQLKRGKAEGGKCPFCAGKTVRFKEYATAAELAPSVY